MSLTAEGNSRETLIFPPGSAHEGIGSSRVTHVASAAPAAPAVPAVRATRAAPAAHAARGGPARRLAAGARSIRRHWMLIVLLFPGLALRVVTQLAYRPALLYIDSPKYLVAGLEKFDPEGYRVLLLKPVLAAGNLALVAAVQHVIGLAMAVTLYSLLIRRQAPRWAAALATAPILLDAYQLQMEQTIMPDVLFEALILTGLAILLWNPGPGLRAIGIASFVLGLSATVRQVGEILFLPALAFAVLAARGWRRRLTVGALVMVSFAIPILVYMTYSATMLGDRFQLSDQGDGVLYGRAAVAADCATLRLAAELRPICPAPKAVAHFGIDGLVNDPLSPVYTAVLPAGVSRAGAAVQFSYRVMEQQPLRVAGSVAGDAVKLFALTRHSVPGDTPLWRWQFQPAYELYPPAITSAYASSLIHDTGGGGPAAARPLAAFLRAYQLHGGYTPGPYLLVALLGGLAGLGGLVTGRRGRDRARDRAQDRARDRSHDPAGDRSHERAAALACLLATGTGVAVLLGADYYEFSWRYQLPALITLPAAGALGVAAIAARIRRRAAARATTATLATRTPRATRRPHGARTPHTTTTSLANGPGGPPPPVTLVGCRTEVINRTSGPSGPGSYTKTAGSG